MRPHSSCSGGNIIVWPRRGYYSFLAILDFSVGGRFTCAFPAPAGAIDWPNQARPRCRMSLRVATVLGGILLVSPATAQVVQLPSFETFSVQTSVLVPDSGAAYLGGVNRSS